MTEKVLYLNQKNNEQKKNYFHPCSEVRGELWILKL